MGYRTYEVQRFSMFCTTSHRNNYLGPHDVRVADVPGRRALRFADSDDVKCHNANCQ